MDYLYWTVGILLISLLGLHAILWWDVVEGDSGDPSVWIRLRSAVIVQRGKDHYLVDMTIVGWCGWATVEVPVGHLIVRDRGRELLLTPGFAQRIAEDLAIDLERFGERIEMSDPGAVQAAQ